ncbi:TetR/AcrR family transcriptional regulator [Shewanella intestini]|uniref:TetR/AcrR family transcriptional regulator n=1 Tax=Shewanella intestini TaxID=2017544 RepID=A0ABS5I4K4_9GAMM|nr:MULTISPECIES: TetR/AcrR family transcriptional regulator [Shewanella]MBR9728956.1 TetR/AcrR family transcriptional regulator [Shewanella intestini]MRG36979.1 TetR family transcriptional regulator [Shewanella sp. XMDDZSB0408]
MSSDLRPKQQRSQLTHDKFLLALQNALADKYFEHISIKELAKGAGVSVGTFYRRFENKEALLPLLYDDFGLQLEQWVNQVEVMPCESLVEQVAMVSQQTATFLLARKSVFRTIHLNSRLHTETLFADPSNDRKHVYQRIAALLLAKMTTDTPNEKQLNAANMAVFMLVNGILDQILYPHITPAIACQVPLEDYLNQLIEMICAYLAIHSH